MEHTNRKHLCFYFILSIKSEAQRAKGSSEETKKERNIRTCFTKAATAPTNALFLFCNIPLRMCHKFLMELQNLSTLL